MKTTVKVLLAELITYKKALLGLVRDNPTNRYYQGYLNALNLFIDKINGKEPILWADNDK